MTSFAPLAPGALFADDFRVVRFLARGGMADVYVVEQVGTGKRRALKVLHDRIAADPRGRERFAREARATAAIASEHVVEVVAAGVDDALGVPWLAMELLEGEDLARALARRRRFSAAEARELFAQLGHALAAAHRAGVVHRDLKPENVFVARSRYADQRFTVKVLDFGLARLVDTARAEASTTAAVGSPLWMAPEQCEAGRDVSPATDVWALGLLAFLLLTGRSYWRASAAPDRTTMAVLREVLFDPLPPASQRAAEQGVAALLPAGFDAWFARCVARAPATRFADAGEALAALDPLLAAAARTDDAMPAEAVVVERDEAAALEREAAAPRPTLAGPTVADGGANRRGARPARRAGTALVAAGVLIGVAGVLGAFVRQRRHTAHTGPLAATRVDAPARDVPLDRGVSVLPAVNEVTAYVVERDGDGVLLVGAGVRLRGDAAGMEVARGLFATPIVAVARVASGWLFVSNDGVVASAPTFLGPLTVRDRRPGPNDRVVATTPAISRDRLPLVDATGALWLTDGAAPLSRATLPAGVAAVSAAFLDHDRGALVTRDARVLWTRTGGAQWDPVELADGALATRVRFDGAGLFVDTSPAGARLDEAGRATAVSGAWPPSLINPNDGRTMRDAVRRLIPELLLSATGAVVRADGVVLLSDQSDLHMLDGRTGRLLRRLPTAFPTGESCSLRSWGPNVAAVCTASGRINRVEHDGRFVPTPVPPIAAGAAGFSDDGFHGVVPGPCAREAGTAPGAAPSVCGFDARTGQLRAAQVALAPGRVVAMHGAEALLEGEAAPNGASPALRVVDPFAGTEYAVRVSGGDPDAAIVARTAGWTADGVAYVQTRGRDPDGPSWLAVGDPREGLVARALPRGARAALLRDATTGVAVGDDGSALWTTRDAGRSWQPVVLEPALRAARVTPAGLRCTPLGCGNGTVWFGHPGRAAAGPLAVVANPDAAPTPRIAEHVARCAPSAAAVAELAPPAAPALAATVPRGAHRVEIVAPRARGVLGYWSVGAALWAQLAWRGRDALGAYQSATRPAVVPGASAASFDVLAYTTGRLVVRHIDRAGVLLERVAHDTNGVPLVWAPARGALTLVDRPFRAGREYPYRSLVGTALPMPDGGMALVVEPHRDGFHASSTVMRLSRDGTVLARRTVNVPGVTFTSAMVRGLAIVDGVPALAVRRAGASEIELYRVDERDGPPTRLAGPGAAGTLPVCQGRATPEATRLMGHAGLFALNTTAPLTGPIRAVYEWSPAGACLRSIESWAEIEGTTADSFELASDGVSPELHGAVGSLPVRCRME